ncbi:MAG TPA: ABC transporter permease [Acidimicrobiia bacterium]|nr:ABC transporter permease [Acidimicrobiia bacterium]
MSIGSRLTKRARRGAQIGSAFFHIGVRDSLNYPLALVMQGLATFVPIVTFMFVAELVGDNGADVAFDYYTFVVLGIATMSVLGVTLNSFGGAMLNFVTQGQLEMFLVEPMPWRALPFALVPWPTFQAFATASAMVLLSIPLGAEYALSGVPIAILIVLMGFAATLAVGILGASIKVLSKRTDPVLQLYTIAASVLSGAFFPLELLPPWIRAFSWVIPHTYVIQALRRVLMPQGEVLAGPTAWQAIGALAIFSLVMYPIALWVFGRTLEYGRKIGALSGY